MCVLQAELQVARSEVALQKSLNQQLMNRKQDMEWQLLAALSAGSKQQQKCAGGKSM